MALSSFLLESSGRSSAPVELDYGNQFQSSNFPDWMSQKAPIGSLKGAQKKLGKFFNFDPIQQAGNQYINSNFEQQRAATGAAARAAQNRAMLSGGRVGASFAQASAMLPLYNQKNQQALGLAQLQGQMQGQRAGIHANLAQSIAQAKMGQRGLLSDYAMGQQRLGQDQRQFDSRMQLENQQLGLQRDQLNSQNAANALKLMGPGAFSYNTYNDGTPITQGDREIKGRSDSYQQARMALMGKLGGF